MRRWVGLIAGIVPIAAQAQPIDLPIAPATTDHYPPGVQVISTKAGPVYADAKGHVLYGMDMRVLIRWSPDPAQFCQADCQKDWVALLAPADAKVNIRFPQGFGDRAAPGSRAPNPNVAQPGMVLPQSAPDWSVIKGPNGPQWVYKGWHMVYVRHGGRAGDTKYDGAEKLTWNSLKFIPPVPAVSAPAGVQAIFTSGAYALADKTGHALFTGQCGSNCAGWQPMLAGMSNRDAGDWTVDASGDQPQWRYRGALVYISKADDPMALPTGGSGIKP